MPCKQLVRLPYRDVLEDFPSPELAQNLIFGEWQSFKYGARQETVAGAADKYLQDFSMCMYVSAWQEGRQISVPPLAGRCANC